MQYSAFLKSYSANAHKIHPNREEGSPPQPRRKSQQETGTLCIDFEGNGEVQNLPSRSTEPDSDARVFFVNGAPKRIRPGSFYGNRKEVRDYDGDGYVQDNYPVPEAVHTALVTALTCALGYPPNEDEVRLTAHVWLVGALRHDDDPDGFVPIPYPVLARDVPDADVEALILSSVLGFTWESHADKRCREYAVSPFVSESLDSALSSALRTAPDKLRFVNLFTGKARRGRKPGNVRYDGNRNPIPQKISAAMESIPQGIINLPSVNAHLDRLKAIISDAETEKEQGRARARWRNDAACVSWIVSRGLTATEVPGIYTYPHAWKAQTMGRIMPRKSGGAQSLSRAGKAAMYDGIAEVVNYDWTSSQPRILQDELRNAGLECEWLDAYLSDSKAKHVYAGRVGCSVDAWKGAFMAAITGGDAGVPLRYMEKPVTRFIRGEEVTTYKPVCEAMKTLLDDVGRAVVAEVWKRLRDELDELLSAVRAWHRHLTEEWVPSNATHGRGGVVVTNAVGASLRLDDYGKGELPRKVAAHVLQGREALLTHALAGLGKGYGYAVVSHEHDGLVTLGTIPAAAIEEAKREAGMPFAELVPKPFLPNAKG